MRFSALLEAAMVMSSDNEVMYDLMEIRGLRKRPEIRKDLSSFKDELREVFRCVMLFCDNTKI